MVAESRQKMLQSQIPVMAPRQSQSSLPSSLSTPHLGLVPTSRHLAVSGNSTHTPVNQNLSTSPGLTPFRSFRNFLSFGPGKSQSANSSLTTASSLAGSSRLSVSSLRRSTNGDRSVSAPHLPATYVDNTPVISIEPSHRVELSHKMDEPLFDSEELQSRLSVQSRTPENGSPVSSVSTFSSRASVPTPEQPGKFRSLIESYIVNSTSSHGIWVTGDFRSFYHT